MAGATTAHETTTLMEEKGSKAQGRHGEVGSEGSAEQRYEPTNRNWIRGGKAGRGSVRSRSPYPSKASTVNPAVGYRKESNLPREVCGRSWEVACHGNWLSAAQAALTLPQKSAAGIVGERKLTEGPNGREGQVGVESYGH
jgi:hypothetical protein